MQERDNSVPLGSVGEALEEALGSVNTAVLPEITPEAPAKVEEPAAEDSQQKETKLRFSFEAGKHRATGELFTRAEFYVGGLDDAQLSEEDVAANRGQILSRVEIIKAAGAPFCEIYFAPVGSEEDRMKVAELQVVSWMNEESIRDWKPFYGIPKLSGCNFMCTFSYKRQENLKEEYQLLKDDLAAIRAYIINMISHSGKWKNEHKNNKDFLEIPITTYWAKSAYDYMAWKKAMVNREIDGYIVEKDPGQAAATVTHKGSVVGTISIKTTRFHGYRSHWETTNENYMSVDMQELSAMVIREALED